MCRLKNFAEGPPRFCATFATLIQNTLQHVNKNTLQYKHTSIQTHSNISIPQSPSLQMNHLSATSPIEARGTTIQNTSKPLNTPIVTTWYPVSGPFREANFHVNISIHENLNPSIAFPSGPSENVF